jgi:hypothetical protein
MTHPDPYADAALRATFLGPRAENAELRSTTPAGPTEAHA